jgi:hypothetical protein
LGLSANRCNKLIDIEKAKAKILTDKEFTALPDRQTLQEFWQWAKNNLKKS